MFVVFLLWQVFGFDGFWFGQQEIVEVVVEGQNVLVIMLIGGGKLLCYQLFVLMWDGLMVVILLLIVLMCDQVWVLIEVGVVVVVLISGNFEDENVEVWCVLLVWELKLLYMVLECLVLGGMILMLKCVGVQVIVVDEVYCVS